MAEIESDASRDASKDVGPPRPWVLVVDFEIILGREAEFLQAIGRVNDAMRHEESFMANSLFTHPTAPNRFRQVEVWRDRQDFIEVQVPRPYRKPYDELVKELIAAPIRYSEWYELRADYVHHLKR